MLFHYPVLKHFEESSTASVRCFCNFEFEKVFHISLTENPTYPTLAHLVPSPTQYHYTDFVVVKVVSFICHVDITNKMSMFQTFQFLDAKRRLSSNKTFLLTIINFK